jgi:hypothetical protein
MTTVDPHDLTAFLKQAVLLRKHKPPETGNITLLRSQEEFKSLLLSTISDILIGRRYISAPFFLCGSYIAGLLTSVMIDTPKSWWVIDYVLQGHEKNNPATIQAGANLCFLICTIFKERADIRAMRYEDYEKLGIGLFYQLYGQTGKEIGYHMSDHYKKMVTVTDECVATL